MKKDWQEREGEIVVLGGLSFGLYCCIFLVETDVAALLALLKLLLFSTAKGFGRKREEYVMIHDLQRICESERAAFVFQTGVFRRKERHGLTFPIAKILRRETCVVLYSFPPDEGTETHLLYA